MIEVDSYEEYPHFFQVKLDLFDGPIDLLLHLVKENELEITRVSLAEVTNQYLACLEQMRRFDLEIAGEYLVIAATLLSAKSSLLLEEPVELIEDDFGNLVDPHEELLRRLREAEIYKEGARMLDDSGMLGRDVFAPPGMLGEFAAPPVEYHEHDPFLLGKAFQKLLNELEGAEARIYTVTLESVSIVERMMGVLDTLRKHSGPVVFYKLIPDLTSRGSIIGTFVALLELCKRQAICVQQVNSFEEIQIALSGTEFDSIGLVSEFDQEIDEDQAGQEIESEPSAETVNQ